MRIRVFINDTDLTDSVLAKSLRITQSITDRVSTASLSFKVEGAGSAVYDEALYDTDVYGVDVRELYEIRIEQKDTGFRLFGGTVRQIRPERKRKDLVFLNVDCLDHTTILDEAYITEATFAAGQTDRAIIQALISTYAPSLTALTANIANLVTLGPWTIKEKTLREALDELVEVTGGEYRIDYHKNLQYFLPGTYVVPFGFSNKPDYVTKFPIDALMGYSRDAIRLVNRCTVLGAVQPGGARLKVVYNDPISQSQYGIRPATIVDDQITIGANASLRAKSVVDQNGFPRETLTLKTMIDGLEVGQTIPIEHTSYQINGNYIIRDLTLEQLTKTKTQYTLTVGAREPDTLRLLKQIDARSRRNTNAPTAVPAPGTVTDESIGAGGLNANNLYGTITGTDISVSASVIAGTISGTNVAVDAGTIQGVITGTSVAVDVGVLQGAIISSQVADNLIDRLSLFNSALRPIPEAAAHPALPSPNYPNGSVYRNTSDGQFYVNSSGTWTLTDENTAVNGKVTFFHVGTIKAGSIIGLVAAGQIGTVNAGSIIGTLTSANTGRIDVSALTGTLTVGNAAKIDVGSLQGVLSAGAGAQISVGALQGKITGTMIDNLTITGTNIQNLTIGTNQIGNLAITDAKVNDLSANKLTVGTLNGSVVNVINLNASAIATGTFAADRIGAGTISATVTMTSPVLSISGGGFSVNVDATNKIKVTDTVADYYAQVLGGQFRLQRTSDAFTFTSLVPGGLNVSMLGGTATMQCNHNGFFLNSQRIVGPRMSAVTQPLGGATIDSEARTAINAIRSVLSTHGLTS